MRRAIHQSRKRLGFSIRFTGIADANGRFAQTGRDCEITDDMAPQLDLNDDWNQILKMPAEKVDRTKEYLKR